MSMPFLIPSSFDPDDLSNEQDDTSSGEEYESSSDSDIEQECAIDCANEAGGVPREVGVLRKSIVLFLCL